MGRRSTFTTKSGKFMNPTDQARKEARKRELKKICEFLKNRGIKQEIIDGFREEKNKKQRKMVREAVLKTKDPKRILDEIEKIETFEIDAGAEPLPNDKALKDKKKKLRETIERLQRLYDKDDPQRAIEIQKLLADSDQRRQHAYVEAYESKQKAEMDTTSVPDIPLPTNIPLPHSGMLMPSDIPLPGPLPGQQPLPPGLTPPGPPPGNPPVPSGNVLPPVPQVGVTPPDPPPVPPPLHPPGVNPDDIDDIDQIVRGRDSKDDDDDDDDDDDSGTSESGLDDDDYDPEVGIGSYSRMETGEANAAPSGEDDKTTDSEQHHRSVRFADEVHSSQDDEQPADPSTSAVQKALLKISGQAEAKRKEAQLAGATTDGQRPGPPGPPRGPPGPPPGVPPRGMPPMVLPVQPNFQIRPPPNMMGNPPRMFPPGPPPGRPPGPPPGMPGGLPPGGLPPGPPPGMPPNMAAQVMGRGPRPLMQQPMMPPGPPPRMMRPPGPPPPRMMPPPQGAVLSAPPSVISKPPVTNPAGDITTSGILKKDPTATISAKPQIRNTQAEITRLVPTSLRIKREAPKAKTKGKTGTETVENRPQHIIQPAHSITGQATKDDAYAQFMREMEGLL